MQTKINCLLDKFEKYEFCINNGAFWKKWTYFSFFHNFWKYILVTGLKRDWISIVTGWCVINIEKNGEKVMIFENYSLNLKKSYK